MDPNLKNFAVFINSSSSTNKTTEKSNVRIPFTGNMAASDPTKALSVMISQFRFTNSIYNIDSQKNTLKIACQFAPGRGYTSNDQSRLWETWTVRVPPGTYNTQELATYLSLPGNIYPENNTKTVDQFLNKVGYESISQKFEYAGVDAGITTSGPANPAFAAANTYANCFVGFGAIPADPTDQTITPGVVTADNGTRTIFRSPDLSHLIQFGTDITTPCVNILGAANPLPTNSTLDFSYVYKAIYLLFDEETSGLLKIMGYYNIDRIPAPKITGYYTNQGIAAAAQGYGIGLSADTVYKPFPQYTNGVLNPVQTYDSATMRVASQNTTFYRVTPLTGQTEGITETPSFPVPVGFSGYFYSLGPLPTTSVAMYVLYQANTSNTNYIFLEPGVFISGTGVSVPNPYVVNFVETRDITAGTDPLTPNIIYFPQAAYEAANGYGLTVGSPITLDSTTSPFNAASSLFGYYVVSIFLNAGTAEYELTLNLNLPAPLLGINVDFMTSVYTLNIPQNVTNLIGTYTNWVSTLLSLNERTGRLIPNLLTNLEGVGEIHIHCAQLRTQYFSSVNFQPLAPSDVICVVPVDAPFGSAQTYSPPITLVAYLTTTNIVTLDIQLTNAAGQSLDFNGIDWSLVLKCEEVEILSDVQQNTNGTLNTVYQDQLAAMESTAHSQVRMERHRSKRMLPYQFFDNNELHRKKGNSLA